MTHARGADFSSNQDDVHLQGAINQGLAFAMVKTTEGVDYVSPSARMQIARLEVNGVRVGLYHFLTSSHDGADQWDHFERTSWARGMVVACDQETDETGTLVPDSIARAFIRRGRQRGYRVGRYGDGRVMGRHLGEDWRWVAWWGSVPPPIRWDVWQFADGRDGAPDWNVFNGDRARLDTWWQRTATRRRPLTRMPQRWWLHDDFAKAARGPYRLPQLGPAVVAYAVRHPRSGRLRLERK